MNIQIGGKEYEIIYCDNGHRLASSFKSVSSNFVTFDTETTGLHIRKDRPFLGALCAENRVFVFETTVDVFSVFPQILKDKRVYAHNATYDMHMMANIMGSEFPLQFSWGDTMGLARLTFEAISTRDGGDSLALKQIAKKYLDSKADQYEKSVKSWLKAKEASDKKVLIGFLHGIKDEGGKWSIKRFQEAFNKGTDHLPKEVLDVHRMWKLNYPKPTYADVPMEIMLPYLAVDVILTQQLVDKAFPVILFRGQKTIASMEFDLLKVVYKMERVGVEVDREYLQESNKKLEDYIQSLYVRLHMLTGMEFSVGQHAVIKKMYADLLGEEPASTDKKFLSKMSGQGDEVATIITRLRRLEKWKETYIERILEASEYDGRFYTQLNQFNPVSGRFSGDSQQFPKDPIYTEDGYRYEQETGNKPPSSYILYHPRRAFKGKIFYLDYSQVELRVQAHYTLAFGGDTNLCRAYMPYGCKHFETGETYNHMDRNSLLGWSKLQPSGESVWIIPESGKPWEPTDVHTATTLNALIAMGIDPAGLDDKTLKWWRNKGKTFNFMRNYGGGDYKAAETLEIDLEQARALNKGYTDAFPVVVTYQTMVVSAMKIKGFVKNLLGRRYYVSNWNKFYKCANYLIQGSCADVLKEKMIEIDMFLTSNNLKSRMVMCIHDELQFEVPDDEHWIIPKIKAIMEDTPNIHVPIVAEVEYTNTYWSDKKPYDTMEER
jgi:DNA polymerase-1